MTARPTFIPLPPRPPNGTPPTSNPSSGLSSPRMPPVPGEVAPTLSPLDLFAAQSRALARQLEETRQNGRRVSRLPPLAVADGLAKKPGFSPALHNVPASPPLVPPPSTTAPHPTQSNAPSQSSNSWASPQRHGTDSSASSAASSAAGGTRPEIENPAIRPHSVYPRLSGLPHTPAENSSLSNSPIPRHESFFTPAEQVSTPAALPRTEYFGPVSASSRRTRSPEPWSSPAKPRPSFESVSQSSTARSKASFESHASRRIDLSRGLSVESTASRLSQLSGHAHSHHVLAPPNPPYAQHASSIRSVDSDDDNPGISHSTSSLSQTRKLSSSSGFSLPQSPHSTFAPGHRRRSPSSTSEHSVNSHRLSRPAFNFSRPISRSSGNGPPLDLPTALLAAGPPHIVADEDVASVQADIVLSDDASISNLAASGDKDALAGAPSYIYTSYSLPRGRSVGRDSLPLDSLMPRFEWEDQPTPAASRPAADVASPSTSRTVIPFPTLEQGSSSTVPFPSLEADPKTPSAIPPADLQRLDTLSARPPPIIPAAQGDSAPHRHSMTSLQTATTGSTIKAPSQGPSLQANSGSTNSASHTRNPVTGRSRATSTSEVLQRPRAKTEDLSPEDHLAKGIACHEHGSLKESTYHLRIAARQNNPTAMLLYALACRHGWGMRPNATEGVAWLRKAMDCSHIQLTHAASPGADAAALDRLLDASTTTKNFGTAATSSATNVPDNSNGSDASSNGTTATQSADTQSALAVRRARQAQFALAVYELGVSHLNGWGVEQDRALALRCFEIAASWGDIDATAEAGFCYARGVGCKKDLYKAARYYRKAEQGGMSMVGNSWIHKTKYDSKDEATDTSGRTGRRLRANSDKKPRDKSRTRSIFGRKKPVAVA